MRKRERDDETAELYEEVFKPKERTSARLLKEWLEQYPGYIFLRRNTFNEIELSYERKKLMNLVDSSIIFTSWERDIKRFGFRVVKSTHNKDSTRKVWRQIK